MVQNVFICLIDCGFQHLYILMRRRVWSAIASHYHHSNAIRAGALMEADMRRDSIRNGDL